MASIQASFAYYCTFPLYLFVFYFKLSFLSSFSVSRKNSDGCHGKELLQFIDKNRITTLVLFRL